ncbi:MAG: c-type cytochrome [Planctomycetes bacterium]|nr:c-type cytochrome [Planctomycetota bacterium]
MSPSGIRRIPVLFAAALAIAIGCGLLATWRDFSEPNWETFTDMDRGPASISQSRSAFFADGLSMRVPPAGTVPVDLAPFPYPPGGTGRTLAGRGLANPLPPTFPVLARGRELYERFCDHCHGPWGAGDGAVAVREPALGYALNGQASRALSDGEIFHLVTFGRAAMPGHAAQIPREDRWRIVHYLRALQREANPEEAPLPLLTPQERTKTTSWVARGKTLYTRNCQACHGEEGRGGVPNPNYLKATVPALDLVAERMFVGSSDDAQGILVLLAEGRGLPDAKEPPYPLYSATVAKYQSIRQVILDGNEAGRKDPAGREPPLHMPVWRGRLSEEDVDSLVAYFLTLYPWEEEDE